MRAAAIIAAGGGGRRFGGSIKKQYIRISGIPLLAWTLNPFLLSESIEDIILVVPEEDIEFCRNEILPVCKPVKKIRITAGGENRQMSVRNGLGLVSRDTDIVVVHDGARPFVGVRSIEQGLEECSRHGAAIFAVPETDTIIEAHEGVISSFLDRERIWRVQTPQIFLYRILVQAFQRAEESGLQATDESALVRDAGFPVRVLHGAHDNIKITIPEDLDRAELILKQKRELTAPAAGDVHPECVSARGGIE